MTGCEVISILARNKDGRISWGSKRFPISTEMRECPAKDLYSETFEMVATANVVGADVSNQYQFRVEEKLCWRH